MPKKGIVASIHYSALLISHLDPVKFCTRNLVNHDIRQEPSTPLSGCLIGRHWHIFVYILCTVPMITIK